MSDGFMLDTDPLIPTGVPASPERVAELVEDGTVPEECVPLLDESQQSPKELEEDE